jgi:hypothetical protein
VQEARLRNPALFFDQNAVHDGNLPGRSAKADETELQPETQGFG